ncbi:hypothetical protein GTO89_11160 [Heliobacterium gestii]|uniref:Uncharacterized protein n=1 Tax=Heliomicrobium gestii TaxID=2699 RepID=A0A845LFA9_HELGE|nr:hypothetical protein [Heliomicrobium gestii]MBM7867333.1 hypothetical protein [Heliomicrobium gestii]MZP43600.1 hypothetical protein [Heliomicrobium gestii]
MVGNMAKNAALKVILTVALLLIGGDSAYALGDYNYRSFFADIPIEPEREYEDIITIHCTARCFFDRIIEVINGSTDVVINGQSNYELSGRQISIMKKDDYTLELSGVIFVRNKRSKEVKVIDVYQEIN